MYPEDAILDTWFLDPRDSSDLPDISFTIKLPHLIDTGIGLHSSIETDDDNDGYSLNTDPSKCVYKWYVELDICATEEVLPYIRPFLTKELVGVLLDLIHDKILSDDQYKSIYDPHVKEFNPIYREFSDIDDELIALLELELLPDYYFVMDGQTYALIYNDSGDSYMIKVPYAVFDHYKYIDYGNDKRFYYPNGYGTTTFVREHWVPSMFDYLKDINSICGN